MHGYAERPRPALRPALGFEPAARAIAADRPVIGHGIERAVHAERRAIAALAAIILVFGDLAPAPRLPQPHAFAAAKGRGQPLPIGREGEMGDQIVEAAETGNEPTRGCFEDVNGTLAKRPFASL